MPQQTETIQFVGEATYKGRVYPCLFIGDTQYGKKAKLCFHDNPEKCWWVRLDALTDVEEFPQSIDPEDYRRPVAAPRGDDHEPDAADDYAAAAGEELPCYCSQCGQRIP